VDQRKAKAAARTVAYNGQTYYFCSDDCKTQFAKEPAKYSRKTTPGPLTPAGKRLSEVQWEGGKAQEKESTHTRHAHPPAPTGGSSGHQHP
jgi:YHS domain-containing protein